MLDYEWIKATVYFNCLNEYIACLIKTCEDHKDITFIIQYFSDGIAFIIDQCLKFLFV